MTEAIDFPKLTSMKLSPNGGGCYSVADGSRRLGWRFVSGDRAARMPWRIAMHQLATGAGEYHVRLAARSTTTERDFLVTVTDEQALDFLRAWADREGFIGRRELRKGEKWLARREARLTPQDAA